MINSNLLKSHRFLSDRCFHGFCMESNLIKHQEKCIRFRVQGTQFPEDDHLFFKSYRRMVKCPVYIVAGILCHLIQLKIMALVG